MTEGTPRRGSTVAAKIAQFRSPGVTSNAPQRPQQEEFWWQQSSGTRAGTVPRGSPRRTEPTHGLPPQHQDTVGCASDQTSPRHAKRHQQDVVSTGARATTSSAALLRLAQEHPSLYNALQSIDRGPAGRPATSAAPKVASRDLDPAATPGGLSGRAAREGVASRAAPVQLGQSGDGVIGHTTTTFAAQPSPAAQSGYAQERHRSQASQQTREQAHADSTHALRDSVEQLMARYRSHDSNAPYGMEAGATTPYMSAAVPSHAPRQPASSRPKSQPAAGAQRHPPPQDQQKKQLTLGAADAHSTPSTPMAKPGTATPVEKPTAEKLQKILRLATLARRLANSPPRDRDANATSGDDVGPAGPSKGSQGHRMPGPPRGNPSRMSSAVASSSHDEELEAEPSLSAYHTQAAAVTAPGDASNVTLTPAARPGGDSPSEVGAAPSALAQSKPSVAPAAAEGPPAQEATEGSTHGAQVPIESQSAPAPGGAGKASAPQQSTPASAGAASRDPQASPDGQQVNLSPGSTSGQPAQQAPAAAAGAPASAAAVPVGPAASASGAGSIGGAPQASAAPASTGSPTHGGAASPTAQTSPGNVQPVIFLPPSAAAGDPSYPSPTHIFIPADPALMPALVAVPGFEPLPPDTLTPRSDGRKPRPSSSPQRVSMQSGHSGSPSLKQQSPAGASTSPNSVPGSTPVMGTPAGSPQLVPAAEGGPQPSGCDQALGGADAGSSAGGATSDVEEGLLAAQQAAAQLERESTSYTRSRLTRLLDEVAAFKRTEGERLAREGERSKVLEELRAMNIEQLGALLGRDSELLKEVNRLKELYTGDLEAVKGDADQTVRQVLDALQAASDSAAAVKEAVVEAALRQQQQAMQLLEAAPPPVAPQPSLATSNGLLQAERNSLFSGPPSTTELLGPGWWTRLLDPDARAGLAGCVAAAQEAGAAPLADPGLGGLLQQRAAGIASGEDQLVLHAAEPSGSSGLAGVGCGEPSVSAITLAARQISLTLDMAVRNYLDRTGQGGIGLPVQNDTTHPDASEPSRAQHLEASQHAQPAIATPRNIPDAEGPYTAAAPEPPETAAAAAPGGCNLEQHAVAVTLPAGPDVLPPALAPAANASGRTLLGVAPGPVASQQAMPGPLYVVGASHQHGGTGLQLPTQFLPGMHAAAGPVPCGELAAASGHQPMAITYPVPTAGACRAAVRQVPACPLATVIPFYAAGSGGQAVLQSSFAPGYAMSSGGHPLSLGAHAASAGSVRPASDSAYQLQAQHVHHLHGASLQDRLPKAVPSGPAAASLWPPAASCSRMEALQGNGPWPVVRHPPHLPAEPHQAPHQEASQVHAPVPAVPTVLAIPTSDHVQQAYKTTREQMRAVFREAGGPAAVAPSPRALFGKP